MARRRKDDRLLNDALEQQTRTVESILIALTIAAIAYGDSLVGRGVSIGFLYLIPLSYSALTHRLWVTLPLSAACVGLRQLFGPLELSPSGFFVRDLALTAIFLSVVTALVRLGGRRRRFFETARRQRDELLEEVELAAEVQENLLKKNQPPPTAYDIVATIEPAKVVGGDYYDFLPMGDDRLGVVIADVAGKGLSAAMLMPAVDITLRALTQRIDDPAAALEEMNRVFYENTGHANYATVFFGVLHLNDGRLRYANGGHLPGLVLRANGAAEWLNESGTPVGLLPGATFQTAEARLEPGDTLLLYTDGVVEVENAREEPFGAERLAAVAAANRGEPAAVIERAIRRSVRELGCDDQLLDDASMIVIKAPGAVILNA